MATKPKVGQITSTAPRFELLEDDGSQFEGARFYDQGSAQVDEPAAPAERSTMRAVGDLGLQFAGGAVSGARMMTDLMGANNRASTGLRSAADALQKLQSAAAQADQQKISAIMQEAESLGFADQVVAGVKAFGVAPGAMVAQALGTSLPTLATAAIPGAGPAAVAARLGAAGTIGAAQGAGNIKGVIYEDVKQKLLASGATAEEAEARAVEAQSYGGENAGQIALGGGLGALAGSTGMERMVSGMRNGVTQAAPGMAARMGMGSLTEAAPEIAQGGQEKFASNTALVNEGFDVNPMAGVVAGATMEGLAGGLMGAAAGIPNPRVVTPGDRIRATESVPETGPMTRAANVATEQKAQAADTEAAALVAVDAPPEVDLQPEAFAPTEPLIEEAPIAEAPPAQIEADPFGEPVTEQPAAPRAARDVPDPFAEPPDLSGRTEEELRQGLRNAQDRGIQRQISAELARRRQEPAAQPGDILNAKGDPFKTKMAAQRAAKTTPGEVVPVAGGFAIRPQQEQPSEPAAQTDQADPFADAPAQAQADTGAASGVAGEPVADDANALDALSNEQNTPAATTSPQAEAAPVEAPAPAGGDVAPAAGVPAATGAGDVQADGVAPKLQRDLAGAKPRYSYGPKKFELSFDSDVDRAAYVIAQEKASSRDAEYLKFVMDSTGMDEAGARAYGQRVKDAIKAQAKDAEPGTLTVPAVKRDAPAAKKPPFASKEDLDHLFGVDQKRQKAIDRVNKGTAYFGTKEKAREFITSNGIKDTHEAVEAKPGRFEVKAKAGETEPKPESAIARRNRLIAEREAASQPKPKTQPEPSNDAAPASQKTLGGGRERVDTSKDKKIGVDSRGRDVFEGSNGSLKGVRYTLDERGRVNTGALVDATPKKPKAKTLADRYAKTLADRADYFAPGNILQGYGGFDEVLAYEATEDGGFRVTVHEVKKVGDEWHRVGKPQDRRQHSTFPEPRQIAAGPVARLGYTPAAEVVYTSPRSDGQPFPNAVDRGTAPAAPAAPAAAPEQASTLQSTMESAGWAGETGTNDTIWTKQANKDRYTAMLNPAGDSMEVTVLVNGVDTQIASFKVGDPQKAAAAASKAVADDVAESAAPANAPATPARSPETQQLIELRKRRSVLQSLKECLA